MKEQLISLETAILAKEKKFYNAKCDNCYKYGVLKSTKLHNMNTKNHYLAPTQALLQKFIRETRGVHIEIRRNAFGYYWSMCKTDGGAYLGWSVTSGPNYNGAWDSFEGALENALQVQLSYDLPNDITIIKHWRNYVEFALEIGLCQSLKLINI